MTLGGVFVFIVSAVVLKLVFQAQVEAGASLCFERPPMLGSFEVLALTFPLVTMIHELGHYAAGVATRQCCRRFVIGPVELARGERRWTIRLVRIRHAGLVDLVPSTYAGFRLQRAICAAGGPLASLLAGLFFTILSLHAETATLFWIWSLGAQWAVVGVLNLVPLRFATARSDGSKLWEAIRGGAVVDEIQREILTQSSHATRLRLTDWPHDAVCRLAERTSDRYASYLAYVHSVDRGDVQAASQYLDRLAAGWTASDPPEYALEAAYFSAFYRNDSSAARKWLAVEPRDAEPWVRLRARAALERADGNPEGARLLIEEGLGAVQQAPACGAYQYEIDRLEALLQAPGVTAPVAST
jgi:hypothetical protein